MTYRLLALFLLLVVVTREVRAQSLTLRISDGTVTLDAHGVTLRQILERWAEVGHVRIIGTDTLEGPPLTLRLVSVPERVALATVLRGLSGYVLGQRAVASASEAAIDRIVILTKTSPPGMIVDLPRRPATIFDRYVRDGQGGVIMLDSDKPVDFVGVHPETVGVHPETGVSMPPDLITPPVDTIVPVLGGVPPAR